MTSVIASDQESDVPLIKFVKVIGDLPTTVYPAKLYLFTNVISYDTWHDLNKITSLENPINPQAERFDFTQKDGTTAEYVKAKAYLEMYFRDGLQKNEASKILRNYKSPNDIIVIDVSNYNENEPWNLKISFEDSKKGDMVEG